MDPWPSQVVSNGFYSQPTSLGKMIETGWCGLPTSLDKIMDPWSSQVVTNRYMVS